MNEMKNKISKIIPINPIVPIVTIVTVATLFLTGCYREPPVHLYDWENPGIELPWVDVKLDLYWGSSDWRSEWYYGKCGQEGGWDAEDKRIFGELEYVEPSNFFVYRYFTDNVPYGKRTILRDAYISGRTFRAKYDWGFWDILAWNDVKTIDGVQSLVFSESQSLDDDIVSSTNQTMHSSRYHAPRYQNSFYEPEQLFSACERGIEIDQNLKDFVYIPEEQIWLRKLDMMLEPLTYIYLPQIILHHNINPVNNERRIKPDSESETQTYDANISGMARSTNLNTGVSGTDAIAVSYKMRFKKDMDMRGETVDIVGGRLMTFGICGQNGNRVSRAEESIDKERHFIDINMQFYNGMDSTFVFDVTDQVRKRYRGGVITIELDMDTVPVPRRPGGSGFDAVVKEFDEETHVIEL